MRLENYANTLYGRGRHRVLEIAGSLDLGIENRWHVNRKRD